MDAFSKIIGIILAIIVAIPAVLFWGYLIYLCFFNSSKKTSKKQEPNQSPPANKAPPSAQLQTKTPPIPKSSPLKGIDFQQIVKSPSFDGARAQMSQLYKEKQKEKEPPKQYVRTYPSPKPVQPPQKPISSPNSEPPPRPRSTYQSIRRDLSSNSNTNSSQIEYSKHRDALITKIHDSGMANYRLYGHPYEFLGFPDNPFVTQDYYPIGLPGQPLKYMVYTSNDGSIYHKRCGCSGASNRLSVFQAFDKNMIPCRICCNCNHNEEYPTWLYSVHDLYLNLVNECFKYDICIQRNDNKQLEFDIDIMEFARLRLIVL